MYEERWIFGIFSNDSVHINPGTLRIFKTKSEAVDYMNKLVKAYENSVLETPLMFIHSGKDFTMD